MKLKYLYKSEWRLPALKVALIVGSILFAINHGKAIYEDRMTVDRWVSAFLSYIVPYCVYIVGRASSSKVISKEES